MPSFVGPDLGRLLIDFSRLALWLAILVAIFVPLERFFSVHPKKILRKGIVTDLGYYFLSGLFPALLLSVPISVLAWFAHQAVPGSLLAATAAWPFWLRVAVGMVVGEVGFYWGHRWCHEIPLLWRFHSIHHSAEEVDFLVNTRAHPLDMVFGRFCGLVPLYILGLANPLGVSGSEIPFLVMFIGTVWGFFVHANVRWRFGPLEWLISTPAFHHWHHTVTPINRNYSSTLPWLDRVFGTHYLPRNEWPSVYGINSKIPDTLTEQLLYPLLPDPPLVAPAKPAHEPLEAHPVATLDVETQDFPRLEPGISA